MPDDPSCPPHRRWRRWSSPRRPLPRRPWPRRLGRPGLLTILAALPLVIIASAAASAAWVSGGPPAAKVRGAMPTRAALRTERSSVAATPVRPVHGGPTIADATSPPHGYWLASLITRRPASRPSPSAAEVKAARAAAARREIVAAATRRAHRAVPPAAAPVHRAVPPAATRSPVGTPLGTFEVTCYDLQGITASGAPVGPGTVAVDPSVIPLGSHIYVQGVGALTALDTGGAIIGRHIDLWEPSYSTCMNWGVESRAVWFQG